MEIQKPLIIELEDAKTEFLQLIQKLQKRGIPCYLIDMLLWDIYQQVKNVAKTELETARRHMESMEKQEDQPKMDG